jgi:hypothetical protein
MQTAAWMRRREKPHQIIFLTHANSSPIKALQDLIGLVVTVLSANKWLWKNEAANLHSVMAIDEQKINNAPNLAGQK